MTFDPLKFVPLKLGDKGEAVERLQGWLTLWGFTCAVDGDFGPETEHRLKTFQDRHHDVHPNAIGYGVLTDGTWKALTAPLARAMEPVEWVGCDAGGGVRIGDVVAKVARQWLAQSVGGGPLRELPGNSGPVVEACTRWLAERDRLMCFCGRNDRGHHDPGSAFARADPCRGYRPDWRLPWCAGWVSTVLRQACESLGVEMPIRGSLSCDELARQAEAEGKREFAKAVLIRGPIGTYPLRPGDLFLVREPGGWKHCGVVLEVMTPASICTTLAGDRFDVPRGGIRTAEGNTNAGGSRNGDRLLERVRTLAGLDFIRWRGE